MCTPAVKFMWSFYCSHKHMVSTTQEWTAPTAPHSTQHTVQAAYTRTNTGTICTSDLLEMYSFKFDQISNHSITFLPWIFVAIPRDHSGLPYFSHQLLSDHVFSSQRCVCLCVKARVYYSDSVTTETPRAFTLLRLDVRYATQFAARSILYVDY